MKHQPTLCRIGIMSALPQQHAQLQPNVVPALFTCHKQSQASILRRTDVMCEEM